MEELQPLSFFLEKGLDSFSIVDVRSPGEFEEDHIPGAVNIPLLDNEERKQVGITYKHEGQAAAKLLGVDIISPKLPQFVRDFLEIKKQNKMIVIYCWRGGLRSFSSTGLVRMAGVMGVRLEGGYQSYRRHVNSTFENLDENLKTITVYGPTGCAKSEVLRKAANMGCGLIDLEKHACHKGSSFGSVDEPGYAKVTQKSFESGIWSDIYFSDKNIFLVEGESKRIGKVAIPNNFFQRMMDGTGVIASAPLDFRVSFTVKNYKPDYFKEDIREALIRIKRYIGKTKLDELNALLDKGDFETFTRDLLVNYYDPMYKHSFPEKPDYVIEYDSVESGAEKLRELYESFY